MTKYREIIRLKSLNFSQRNIALSCNVSRNTVSKVFKRANELNLVWPLDESMTDGSLGKLMFPKEKSAMSKRMPDYTYIRKELLKNGVSKKLLWSEYCEDCRMSGEEPLMYSQFCYYIQKDEEKRRATMHIKRKPGEQIEVDWAGDPAHIIDPDTGEITKAWLFVGVMTYSQYTYVEAFMNEQQKAWITAHIHMYEFFGGVAKILVPDNCATAVNRQRGDWYTPALNTSYYEMAEHYGTAIIPARVRKPKDKPNVESSVGSISTWITAALRNEQFFSLAELNAAIRKKLQTFNNNLFQKKEGSRRSLFLGEELSLLARLPATRFELCDWKVATVQFNYHIAVDKMYYSVPYQYIREKTDVRITDTIIEIFIKHNRIASHRRLYGRPGQYSTVMEHMPQDHQKYLEWNSDRFRKWATKIGPNTDIVIDNILTSNRVEQQSYRSCMGLLKLAEKYSPLKLEAACEKALNYSLSPSYKSIKNLLVTLKDELIPAPISENKNIYGITRGAKYYQKKSQGGNYCDYSKYNR
ncbi:MAG: IS21 family transposase [Tissierellaceae bacterium]|nr:IS21 family transposase [Tissierellaceae bacterium]